MSVKIIIGDAREKLKGLADQSVHCCVTSPPYFGLRDYGCAGQMGLEPSPDEFVAELVAVFHEVRRVLRDDGTLWLNLGDSYANDGKWGGHTGGKHVKVLHCSPIGRNKRYTGLKAKDLIGIPWRVAFALQSDGWYLRQDIIWHKPNPMPESVTDRCTKAHEYIFLLSKSARYFYDAVAICEETDPANSRDTTCARRQAPPGKVPDSGFVKGRRYETRNKRSVWTVSTTPYNEAHFATFPTELIEPCILAGCPAGGTVLDPFGGAGTTGLVADRLQRSAILIELNPEYAAMAEQRIRGDAPLLVEAAE
jgi:DNA modification methylase